jgi:transposase
VIGWQEADSARALKDRYGREAVGEVRTRLHALWLLREGRSVTETAQVVGVHYRTVQRWMTDYRQGGVDAVVARRSGGHGRAARLSAEQAEAVRSAAATGVFRTAAQVREWIEDQFGVAYGEGGIYSVLARLRVHPKVPRPVNPKADHAAQEAWKKGA